MLAGLINDEDRRTANKVPGLGELPIVGRLFGNQNDDGSKTEIILSITPRILRNIQRPDATIIEFDSGTESNLGVHSSSGGGVMSIAASSVPSLSTTKPTTTPSTAGAGSLAPTGAGQSNSAGSNATIGRTSSAATDSGVVSAAPAFLRWQGPSALKAGDSFALQLIMQSDQPVSGLPLIVGFDTKVLEIVSVLEGDFLRQGGVQTSFTSRIDPAGQVLITGARSGDSGASAIGAIVTLNFRVTAAASPETRIQLLSISPVALGGRAIVAPLPLPHVIKIDAN